MALEPESNRLSDSSVVIYQYTAAVRGNLVKRYKRFLADVILQPAGQGCSVSVTGGLPGRGAGESAGGSGVSAYIAAGGTSPDIAGGRARSRYREGRGPGGAAAQGCVDATVEPEAQAAAPIASRSRTMAKGAAARAATGAAMAAAAHSGSGALQADSSSAVLQTGASHPGAVTCHCPNTGPMTGLLDWPLAPVMCSVTTVSSRKYKHTLEMIQAEPGGAWVGVHSALANTLVHSLLMRRLLPQLGEWTDIQREVPYGTSGSRVDFVLTRPTGRRVFVEVKSVTLAEIYDSASDPAQPSGPALEAAAAAASVPTSVAQRRRIALFPDTVSDRAQRHVKDLMEVVRGGNEAACVFVIQRDDCALFAPCVAKDPEYAVLVRQAAAAGVQMLAVRTRLRPPSAPPASSGPACGASEGGAPSSPEPAGAAVAEAGAEALTELAAAGAPAAGPLADGGVVGAGAAMRARRSRQSTAATTVEAAASGNRDVGVARAFEGTADGGSVASIEFLGLAELVLPYGAGTQAGLAGPAAASPGAAAGSRGRKRGVRSVAKGTGNVKGRGDASTEAMGEAAADNDGASSPSTDGQYGCVLERGKSLRKGRSGVSKKSEDRQAPTEAIKRRRTRASLQHD